MDEKEIIFKEAFGHERLPKKDKDTDWAIFNSIWNEAREKFEKEVRKGLYKLKGKVIEKDIGEYDKEVSCWDVQDLMKKILKTSQKQRSTK